MVKAITEASPEGEHLAQRPPKTARKSQGRAGKVEQAQRTSSRPNGPQQPSPQDKAHKPNGPQQRRRAVVDEQDGGAAAFRPELHGARRRGQR